MSTISELALAPPPVMGEDKQSVTFMQYCSMVANFTKTSSRKLESIYQDVLQYHTLDAGDIDVRKDKEHLIIQQIRELRDNTAGILIVLKNSFSNISSLPPSQQLVLNYCTVLIRLTISFSNSAKKLDSSEEIGRLYKEVLNAAKQAVSSINYSLKGSFVSEEQINNLVKNVKDVKASSSELENKVRTRDKTNYFTAARTFVSSVNDLMATSSEMGILEVNLEAKLKAAVVGIMSAGKTALGSTWDSVTAIVSMHEGKEELYLILKELLTKCSHSRKASAMEVDKLGDIHMSLPARTLSPMARTATAMKKSVSVSVPGTPNTSELNLQRSAHAKARAPISNAIPTTTSSPPSIARAATTPHFEIPSSMLTLFATADPSAQKEPQETLGGSLSIAVTPKLRNSSVPNNAPKEMIKENAGSRRASVDGAEVSKDGQSTNNETTNRKSVQIDLTASQTEREAQRQSGRQRSLSFNAIRRLNSTQTISPPTDNSDLRRSDISILSTSESDTQRGNSVHSDVSRGSKDVFTDVDLRGSWDLKQEELNVTKKSKIKLLRKEPKESKDSSRDTKNSPRDTKSSKDISGSKDSKGRKEESKKSQKIKDDRVIEADVPLEEIVQRVTNAFVDQYAHFREEYHAQDESERARSMSLVATSLQTKFPEISTNIPPPPPPPPKKTWKKKLLPSCFKPTRIKSVQLPPEKMGWA